MKLKLALITLMLAAGLTAGEKISERPTLLSAALDADTDWVPIVDMSETGAARDKKTNLTEFWKKLGGTNVSSVELGYLDGVTSSIQTQISGKQATLVSGTNIKTLNGVSVLGSGDIVVASYLTSGPVTSSGGVSAIADGAISGAKVSSIPPTVQTALDGKSALPPSIPVFTKASWPTYTTTVSSGITSLTCRKRMNAIHNADGIQLVFQNCAGELDGFSEVTVKAAVEDSTGAIFPVNFSGSRTATVAVNGTFRTSDVVAGLTVVAGREYYVRTRYSWSSGNCRLPVVVDNASSPGEGRIDAQDCVDNNVAGAFNTGLNYGIGPSMVLGKTLDRKHHPVIGFVGDSIMFGVPGNVSIGGFSPVWEDNWSVSALGYERGRNYSHIRLAMGGSTASVVANVASTKRRMFYPFLTHAICNLGLNDVRDVGTPAQIMANLTVIHKDLKEAGARIVLQTTITPDTSTPGTPGSDESTRVGLNGLIREVRNPLYGIIDAADACETSRDSGVWKTGFELTDLYHPNNTGGAAIRALVPVHLFN